MKKLNVSTVDDEKEKPMGDQKIKSKEIHQQEFIKRSKKTRKFNLFF